MAITAYWHQAVSPKIQEANSPYPMANPPKSFRHTVVWKQNVSILHIRPKKMLFNTYYASTPGAAPNHIKEPSFLSLDRDNNRESQLGKAQRMSDWRVCSLKWDLYIIPTPNPRLREHWKGQVNCKSQRAKKTDEKILSSGTLSSYSCLLRLHRDIYQSMVQNGLGKGSHCTRPTPGAISMLGTLWLP